MQIQLEIGAKANLILNKLENAGFEAYVVGGFVRDALLGELTSQTDIDITTSASTDQIKQIFSDYKTIDTGIRFGTVTVVLDHVAFEVTTYRIDGPYLDGRRPSKVLFTDRLEEDLKRRDFTINAMAYHPNKGLIDPFNGQKDLDKELIRAVGKADRRLEEDRLRMLRAVRFAAKLNFSIEDTLFQAIKTQASQITTVSVERIAAELNKILLMDKPSSGIVLLKETGLLKHIIPDLAKGAGFLQYSKHHAYDVFDHTMVALDQTARDLELRLAILFHDVGKIYTRFIGEDGEGHFYGHDKLSKEIAEKTLTHLRYDKKTIKHVGDLVGRHMAAMNPYTEKSVKRLIRKMGQEQVKKLFYLQIADILATNNPHFRENVDRGLALLEEIEANESVVFRNQLAINGHDIMALGYKEGKQIGLILKKVTSLVCDGDLENDKESIIEYIKGAEI